MATSKAPADKPGAGTFPDRTVPRRSPHPGTQPVSVLVLGKRNTVKCLVTDLAVGPGEQEPVRDAALVTRLGADSQISLIVVTSQRAALTHVRLQSPRAILVEVDGSPQSRLRFCRTLRNRAPAMAILALGHNPPAGSFDFDGFVPLPLNRHLAEAAVEQLDDRSAPQALSCGPFRLDVSARTVETPNGTRRLTPKLAALLEYFMLHCNDVAPRSDIMEAIWQTSYLDDTRTLDVHVRWLRESIEPDPSNPRYLLTERGVGYSLQCE